MRFMDWLSWRRAPPAAEAIDSGRTAEDRGATCKWLPAIARHYCTGCGACVEACVHGCLEMVWDFATLSQPGDCSSEGNCVQACAEGLIRMEWVASRGDQKVGRWHASGAPRTG